ncbi:epoxide hydrolase family protein [Herbiconiux sp. P15]|uniref:epoxide hydrolase family protein n=1 Tax=Herbiconiux liukaitaii TaxID=3342799 RepID=UPI0035B9866B
MTSSSTDNQTDTDTHTVLPFRIAIPDEALADLRDRLRRSRFPAPLPGDDWSTGVPISTLRDLAARWADHDWRATEQRLNAIPQLVTRIDGQTIHALHVVSPVADATPLLLTHGWPGSFLEFEALIGPLTDPVAHGGTEADAFHLVIPSLPGFGFSTPLESAHWPMARIAGAWLELMTRLGYGRFAVQGGDLGAGVAPEVARLDPERIIGVHVNGAIGGFIDDSDDEAMAALTPLERDRMRRVGEFMQHEFGYIAIQSTRPGLIGAMAADSPVAQLAWMLDKLEAWSHPAETPAVEVLGEEFVFANASLYWLTASAGSAALVGYAQNEGWGEAPADSGVPTAAIQFAHDIGIRQVAERANTIVRWTDVEDRGGHFAALEEPEMLVADLREFFRSLR